MLCELDIKNIALIDKLNIEVKQGLTVLTGETGAGKSVIIDSVNLLLGARTNKSLVRYGTDKAMVQGLFCVSDEVCDLLMQKGIETEEKQVIVSRDMSSDGKSVCRINGQMVPQNVLRDIGAYLINIHGQQDNQALLNPSRHIDFLDSYAKTDILHYEELYLNRQELKERIESLSKNEQERIQRIDLLKYQISEIEEAKLKSGEKEELLKQKNIIASSEKLALAVNEAYSRLYEENSAYDAIGGAVSALEKIRGIDLSLDETISKICDTMYVIEDCVHELGRYADGIDFDENLLNDIEQRLDIITRLERKYGGSIDQVLAYYSDICDELESIENADCILEKLTEELKNTEKNMEKECIKITKTRKIAAEKLQKEIEISLTELDMPKVKFEVDIKALDEFYKKGKDGVEFMICPNVGEPLKPLADIASGGELSRVMLAVKTILADSVDTLIFDEIDTGVSGSAAQKIANKLSVLSKDKQVICVSHQAIIASAADNHYKISKHTSGDRTVTEICALSQDERILEIARIIDGDNITQTAVEHAKEMLRL